MNCCHIATYCLCHNIIDCHYGTMGVVRTCLHCRATPRYPPFSVPHQGFMHLNQSTDSVTNWTVQRSTNLRTAKRLWRLSLKWSIICRGGSQLVPEWSSWNSLWLGLGLRIRARIRLVLGQSWPGAKLTWRRVYCTPWCRVWHQDFYAVSFSLPWFPRLKPHVILSVTTETE